MTDEKKLTVAEVAKILEASPATVTTYCREKKFPRAEKIFHPRGDYWLIPEGDLIGVEIKMGRPKKKD